VVEYQRVQTVLGLKTILNPLSLKGAQPKYKREFYVRTTSGGKIQLKESQELYTNKYGCYFGYCTLSYVFKDNVSETTSVSVFRYLESLGPTV
jgi:hypothetical protein